jgi:DNA-binding GntR family transcriptional regulator
MCDYAGVSRTPVREALRQLQREGWARLIANRGVFVNIFSPEEIDDVFRVRLRLEPYAARLAAGHMTQTVLDVLDDCNEQMREVLQSDKPSLDAITRINDRFHRAIINAADSPRLRMALDSVAVSPIVFTTFHRYDHRQLERSFHSHLDLTDAMSSRDGSWAESTMTSHISAARDIFVRSLNNSPVAE